MGKSNKEAVQEYFKEHLEISGIKAQNLPPDILAFEDYTPNIAPIF